MYLITERNIRPSHPVTNGPEKWELVLSLAEPEMIDHHGKFVRRPANFYVPKGSGPGDEIKPMAVEVLQRAPEQAGDRRDAVGLRFLVGGPAVGLLGDVKSVYPSEGSPEEVLYYSIHYDIALKSGTLAVHKAVLAPAGVISF